MSEAELVATFLDFLNEVDAVLFGYVSLMSGFLVMSYLVAHRLPKALAAIVLLLFSVVSGVLILRLVLLRRDSGALLQYIFSQKDAGNLDLSWFGMNSPLAQQIVTYLEVAATVGGFLGCIVFFVYRRRTGFSNIEPVGLI